MKITLRLTCIFFCSALSLNFSAQGLPETPKIELPSIIPPSPTVAAMMVFEEIPVDKYSGQPSIQVPLFSKKLSPTLNLELSLSYSTANLRIHTKAGWVGQGWSLEAGGAVSRTVKGVPDETQRQELHQTIKGVLKNNYWNWEQMTPDQKNEFAWNANGTRLDKYDYEPDLFQFNVMGLSGRFIIAREGILLKTKIIDNPDNVRISIDYQSYPSFVINSFTITDTEGNSFHFQDKEISTAIARTVVRPQSGEAAPTSSGNPETHVSAWHLTEITNAQGQMLAQFTYTDVHETYQTRLSSTRNEVKYAQTNPAPAPQWWTNGYNASVLRPHTINSYYQMAVQTKKVSEIIIPFQGKYKFNITGIHPETNGAYLTNIEEYDENGSVNKFADLTHSITMNNRRLWLDRLEIGPGQTLRHEFNYHSKPLFPANDSENCDSWGYTFKDHRQNPSYGFNYYDFNAFKYGLLSSIIAPTGGVKEFVFEENTYAYVGSELLFNFDKNPRNSETQTVFKTLRANNYQSWVVNGNSTSTVLPTITISHAQNVWVEKQLLFESAPGDHARFDLKFKDVATNQVYWTDISEDSFIYLPAGTYEYFMTPNIYISADNPRVDVKFSLYHLTLKQGSAYVKELLGGGIRIKEINFYNDSTATEKERSLKYYYTEPNPGVFSPGGIGYYPNPFTSSGAVDQVYGSFGKRYEEHDRLWLLTGDANFPGSSVIVSQVYYDITTSELLQPLSKGSFIGYKHVQVKEQGNGWTAFVYTNAIDHPIPHSYFQPPFFEPPNRDHKRGFLLKESVYNVTGVLLKETENTPYFLEKPVVQVHDFLSSPCEWKQFYEYYASYRDKTANDPGRDKPTCGNQPCPSHNNNCGVIYSLIAKTLTEDRVFTASTKVTEYEYDPPGSRESWTVYQYNNVNHLPELITYTVYEGGLPQTKTTAIGYPVSVLDSELFDSGDINIIQSMAAANFINQKLVVTESFNQELIGQHITKYKAIGNGFYPKSVSTRKSTTEAPEPRILFGEYNHKGNPIEVQMHMGPVTTYVYDVSGLRPMAKIENCTLAQLTANSGPISQPSDELIYQNLMSYYNDPDFKNSIITVLKYNNAGLVEEMVDPKGDRQFFYYDPSGRLREVRDYSGNLLNHYEYHFGQF